MADPILNELTITVTGTLDFAGTVVVTSVLSVTPPRADRYSFS